MEGPTRPLLAGYVTLLQCLWDRHGDHARVVMHVASQLPPSCLVVQTDADAKLAMVLKERHCL